MRLPTALAFVVLGAVPACGDHTAHSDASCATAICIKNDPAQEVCGCADSSGTCGGGCVVCGITCVPNGSGSAGACQTPTHEVCADAMGNCPAGCVPEGFG